MRTAPAGSGCCGCPYGPTFLPWSSWVSPMSFEPNGELIPVGGGDSIPLIREKLTVGRRGSCDIPLRLPNVSGLHCELTFHDGFWWIRDLNSTNGIKVNGVKVP